MDPPPSNSIAARKDQHLDIVLQGLGRQDEVTTGFEKIRFAHCALPELALYEIDLSCTFLNKKLAAPLLISSMTGGPSRAERINTHLAEAAQMLGIAFAVGSQRIAIENAGDAGFGRRLRQLAPTIPIYANFGAVQLAHGFGDKEARAVIDMIELVVQVECPRAIRVHSQCEYGASTRAGGEDTAEDRVRHEFALGHQVWKFTRVSGHADRARFISAINEQSA